MPRLFIAVESFVTARRGIDQWIQGGDVAEAGSWPIEAHPGAFAPLQIRWKAPQPDPAVHVAVESREESDSSPDDSQDGGAVKAHEVSPGSIKRGPGRPRKDAS